MYQQRNEREKSAPERRNRKCSMIESIILNDCHLAQLIVHVLHPLYYNVQRFIKVRPFLCTTDADYIWRRMFLFFLFRPPFV